MMDIMDIQAVESKLSDVTVTPIPRSQVQNFYHLQQQQQREQLPQIQISAIHHVPHSNTQSHNHSHSQSQSHQQQQHQHQQQQQHYSHSLSLSQPPTSPLIITTQTSANITTPMTSTANIPSNLTNLQGLTKYAQLLAVIEEMGRDIRPTYTGSRSSTERLKRGIVHARILVRECLSETERSARQ